MNAFKSSTVYNPFLRSLNSNNFLIITIRYYSPNYAATSLFTCYFLPKSSMIFNKNISGKCVFFWAQNHLNTDSHKMPSLCPIQMSSEAPCCTNIELNYFGFGEMDSKQWIIEDASNDNVDEHDAVPDRMQRFVPYFVFTHMDWSFFVEHVYNLHVLSNDKLICILCHYVLQHAHIILSRDRKKRMLLPTTKFTNFVKSQKVVVDELQSNGNTQTCKEEENSIITLVQFVQFNTNSIDSKQKQTQWYNKLDAVLEKKHNNKS
eukprot:20433_1